MTKNKPLSFPELLLSVWYCVPGRVLDCGDTRQTLPCSLHYHWDKPKKKRFLKREKISKYLIEIIIIIINDHTFYEGNRDRK